MQELSGDIKRLEDNLKRAGDLFKDKQRALHQRLGTKIKSVLDTQILASGLNDSRGHIRGYQGYVLGSGGGYVAVRATASSVGRNSPGAITNYLEGGHKTRRPALNSKYRLRVMSKGRFVKAQTRSYRFYYKTQQLVTSLLATEGTTLVREILEELDK